MRNRAKILVLLSIGMIAGMALYGQCTPDPQCVDDDDIPGQFCPLELPKGAINVPYDETVTVIPPGVYNISDFQVTILYIQIDSVLDLPEGIDYFPNEDTLYPDNSYCIQLAGTPTQVGKDTLDIYISVTADVLGTPTKAQVMDDTSIVITIQEFVGIDPKQGSEFQVFQNVPNPFAEQTRLDCYVPYGDRIELNVYNILGVLVHHESEMVPPGEHRFRFDGRGLEPGTYFYRVANSANTFSGKLVKSR
jgi:hypothetical protein